jgi:NAD(P)-dependent dehydrogenase (short-subunit alcohol dehydrogenase family)
VRALVVGGGSCRGLALTRTLAADDHAVRVVTRTEARRAEIEAAGGECWIGTPDAIGTLRYALDNVTVLLWLLGTAEGGDVAALHGSRLTMMLERVTDSTVRGVVYEAAGTVGEERFAAGAHEIREAHRKNEIPFRLLEADPRGEQDAWLEATLELVTSLLGPDRG